jgi:hypothetical protein
VEGAGAIGLDVAAATPLADVRDPDLAAEPVVDRESFGRDPATLAAEPVVDQESYDDVGRADGANFVDEPPADEGPAFWFEDAGTPDRSAVADEVRRRRPSDGR